MSGFSAAWLALREPYDQAARNEAVLDAVASAFANASAVAVTDLGCGTGATMRAIGPRLPALQSWRLVDNDRALLDKVLVEGASTVPGARVTTVTTDLAGTIEPMLGDCDLVTASALLDLVSAAWLDRLAELLARLSCPFYAALSYDGTVALSPPSRLDAEVIAAVNRHQRTNKGFGAALGPDAARTAPERLRAAGFTVIEGRSDWQFGPDDRAIQKEMIRGWAAAARETGVESLVLLSWLIERTGYLEKGRSQMCVGHVDFFAMLPRPGRA
jgi:trans-aconitate methyltransferase